MEALIAKRSRLDFGGRAATALSTHVIRRVSRCVGATDRDCADRDKEHRGDPVRLSPRDVEEHNAFSPEYDSETDA